MLSTWTQLWTPALWAMKHCGVRDYSGDKRVLAGAKFLLKVLGPPDPRDKYIRSFPPIGHHPHARKDLVFAAQLAAFVKEAAPELASNLMWAWRATGAPVRNLHDHSGPKANPLTRHFIFHDPSIPEVEPKLHSHNLPNVGAVLRSHPETNKGSYLFLKSGRIHSHHDDDEGSFHYFGRGIPLALDGLPLQNGATAEQHNAVTFSKPGQPSGLVECFTTTDGADYIRAVVAPRAFACDAMYLDGTHRSGWERQLVLVKAPKPGGIEYLVVKDTVTGPEPCQWNLDVLSRKPTVKKGLAGFPGHTEKGFRTGLDVFMIEPAGAKILLEKGKVAEALKTPRGRKSLSEKMIDWTVVEHWLMHVPAGPGTTFLAVLFPRRSGEKQANVEYLVREETLIVSHPEGREIIFLRPNPVVGTSICGASFAGRAGVVSDRKGRRTLYPLDASLLKHEDFPDSDIRYL
jgi:hypothetical protein